MRHTLNMGCWVLMGTLLIAAGPAAAQSISGFSVSTAGSTVNSGDGEGSTISSVAIQINTASQVKSRFAWNVNADTGVGGTRDQSGTARHNVSFNVTAPGSYSLSVFTQRTGDMNRINDASGCEGQADIGGITGSFTGGTLAAGTLSLGDPGSIGNGGSTTSIPFNQTAAASINRTSNGAAQAHTLTFIWSGNVRSNDCEAAVRVGEGSGATSGCSACGYPGSPSRTQANDGHFVTVTLTNLCGNGVIDTSGTYPGITTEQCDQGAANGTAGSCCNSNCTLKTNGTGCTDDGNVCTNDQCDGSSPFCQHPNNDVCSSCGNSVLDGAEECDEGAGNGAPDTCCSATCTFRTGVCRPAADACDTAESCSGTEATCPADVGVVATAGCTVNGVSNQPCQGGPGADEITGTPGPDVILGGSGDDVLRGRDGDDLLCGEAGRDVLEGGEHDDTLVGGTEDDDLSGARGEDTLRGGEGDDLLNGGVDADELEGGPGADTLGGGGGPDVLRGDAGDDVLNGGAGDDMLDGGDDDDVLQGAGGADTLIGGPGTDQLNGGTGGSDTCSDVDQAGPFPKCEL